MEILHVRVFSTASTRGGGNVKEGMSNTHPSRCGVPTQKDEKRSASSTYSGLMKGEAYVSSQ